MDKDIKMVFTDKLNNGMKVVFEHMPSYRSVSMGVWIGAGSIYERSGEGGMSHFIEHMLFKGTENRSASDIAEEMDAVGGNLNAFTAKECTCFYGRVLDKNASVLAEILADLLCNSRLNEEDIEREKGVVCEEIFMVEDSPEDIVNEIACGEYFKGDPLAERILGSVEGVRRFSRDGLSAYMNRLYCPNNMVVSVAGNFERDDVMNTLNRYFVNKGLAKKTDTEISYGKHEHGIRIRFAEKDTEQTHICLDLKGFASDSAESYALLVLNNALGGSMSSRLFQRIREEKGLAYSVYSYPTSYKASGYFTLYAGTSLENAEIVTKLMTDELKLIRREGITIDELKRSKEQLVSSFLLGQESTSARASAIGRAELVRGFHLSENEIISRINAVDLSAIQAILPAVCDLGDMSVAVVGRCDSIRDKITNIINESING